MKCFFSVFLHDSNFLLTCAEHSQCCRRSPKYAFMMFLLNGEQNKTSSNIHSHLFSFEGRWRMQLIEGTTYLRLLRLVFLWCLGLLNNKKPPHIKWHDIKQTVSVFQSILRTPALVREALKDQLWIRVGLFSKRNIVVRSIHRLKFGSTGAPIEVLRFLQVSMIVPLHYMQTLA